MITPERVDGIPLQSSVTLRTRRVLRLILILRSREEGEEGLRMVENKSLNEFSEENFLLISFILTFKGETTHSRK
jgi:hypothetical protein